MQRPNQYKFILFIILIISALASGCGSSSNNSSNQPSAPSAPSGGVTPAGAPSSVTVTIPSGAMTLGTNAFGTNPLVIPMGTAVTWVNSDTVPHTTMSDTGVWNSGTLAPGASFSFTFNNPGNFSYHCAIHPGMTSMIQVTNTGSPAPTPSPTATTTSGGGMPMSGSSSGTGY